MASRPHRCHQISKSNKAQNPPEIVCERGQAKFTPYLLQSAHQEYGLSPASGTIGCAEPAPGLLFVTGSSPASLSAELTPATALLSAGAIEAAVVDLS
jgi:hypothetical protein